MSQPIILGPEHSKRNKNWGFTCMSGDGTFFLSKSIYWEILYIHRHILQDLVADV